MNKLPIAKKVQIIDMLVEGSTMRSHVEGVGDAWTWMAIHADTKPMIDFIVGNKDAESANISMNNVAVRHIIKIQLTTEGQRAYLEAVTDTFGSRIDFAQLVKIYGSTGDGVNTEKKYSPTECTGAKKNVVAANPNEKNISTSYAGCQNLTRRMSNRRFTRLINVFSNKIDNHCHAPALHLVYYNFIRQHKSLRPKPAMAAGISKRFYSIDDIVKLANN